MRKELIAYQDPKAPISEVFRTLRTNIQFMSTKGKLQTLLVTSTLPGEGKSWVSANLAVTFAQAGKKVILVDADMRKGRQYSIFGLSPRPGLSNYLAGVGVSENADDLANYIQETEVENLYLISAGNIPPNPSELLISDQMINLIQQLKEICDIIIIDGTPSQLVTDSLILTRIVDSTVIVTASKQTKKEDLKRVINNIQNVGGKIAGVIINKMPISTKRYEQSYYYGSTSSGRDKKYEERKNSKESYNSRTKSNTQKVNRPNKNEKSTMPNSKSNLANDKTKNTTKAINKEINTPDTNNRRPANPENKINKNQLPKDLNKENKIESNREISIDRTNDILTQINEYLDQEKKKLK